MVEKNTLNIRQRNAAFLIAPATGFLFGFISYIHYILAIVCLVLIFVYIKKEHNHFSKRNVVLMWLTYLGYTAYGISWFWGAYPIDHLGSVSEPASFLIVFAGWISVTFVISLAAIPGILLGYHLTKDADHLSPVTVSCIAVLVEILGSCLFATLTYAEQSMWGAHYSFNYLGYLLGNTLFNSLFAPIGGVFLLSFFMVYLASILLKLYEGKDIHKTITLIFMFIGLCWVLQIYSTARPDHTEQIAVYTDNTQSSFGFNWDAMNEKVPLITQDIENLSLSEPEISLFVLPEDTRYLEWYNRNNIAPPNANIIDSARLTNSGISQSRVMTYAVQEKTISQDDYTKQLLVSEGEYLSIYYETILSLLGFHDLISEFKTNREYQRGYDVTISKINNLSYGVSMCSEILSPYIQSQMSDQSSVLINLASHNFLKGHPLLEKQTALTSQVRAAENNRYIVRSNNYSPALIIDNHGNIINQSTKTGFITSYINHYSNTTLFGYYPLLFPMLISLFLIVITLTSTTLRKNQPHKS